ncbi:MAG: hypothetical protein R3C59_27775 [Planctomycetaceae bacterium]
MINRMQEHDRQSGGVSPRQDRSDGDKSSSKNRTLEQIESVAREYPIALIVFGLAVGVTLGWWVKRK